MFKSNVEVDQTVLQPMASAGGSVKKVIHPKVSVVKEEAPTTSAEALGRGPATNELTKLTNPTTTTEPGLAQAQPVAFTLPSDSKIID